MAETKAKTDKKHTKETPEKPKVSIGRTQDFSIIYADGARLSISAYDIKLTFTITESLFNNDVRITEIATVVLSPQHAKDLAKTLTANVADYEKNIMPLDMKDYPPINKD